MRVLVLGGTGFIGRAAVIDLVGAGHEVCIVHRGEHEPDDLPEMRHIHTDRMELEGVRDELVDFDPEAVLDNTALHREHVDVVFDVLPAGLRYVVTSSVDVYRAYAALLAGRASEPVPIDETSPVREERYPYRERGGAFARYEKLDVEERYRERDATILRLPMVYGEHDYQRREEPVLRRGPRRRRPPPRGWGGWGGRGAPQRGRSPPGGRAPPGSPTRVEERCPPTSTPVAPAGSTSRSSSPSRTSR
jgi:nucleoside-diphosphate-sugar epimerase